MKVICNAAGYCSEKICKGKKPHDYGTTKLGKCPKNPYAEFIEWDKIK